MADKEERIWLEFDIPKPKGAIEATRCTTMTRQEAIERMAKALCNWYYTACSECALMDKPKECKALLKDANFYEQAESELNALLEGK